MLIGRSSGEPRWQMEHLYRSILVEKSWDLHAVTAFGWSPRGFKLTSICGNATKGNENVRPFLSGTYSG
jgi:hypothetical protein